MLAPGIVHETGDRLNSAQSCAPGAARKTTGQPIATKEKPSPIAACRPDGSVRLCQSRSASVEGGHSSRDARFSPISGTPRNGVLRVVCGRQRKSNPKGQLFQSAYSTLMSYIARRDLLNSKNGKPLTYWLIKMWLIPRDSGISIFHTTPTAEINPISVPIVFIQEAEVAALEGMLGFK